LKKKLWIVQFEIEFLFQTIKNCILDSECILIYVFRNITTKNSHITSEFSYKFVKKICKKKLFPAIFSKNFNWQIIPSWVIISYKIIKFTKSVLYKIFCKNIDSNFQQFFFHNKIYKYFLHKNFKTKLIGNMSCFNSTQNYYKLYFEIQINFRPYNSKYYIF